MKTFLKRKGLILLLIIAVLTALCVGFAIVASAADSGETFAKDYYYDMEKPITPGGSITFVADITVPQKAEARGWIVGNYVNFSGKEFGIELNKKGFRVFVCKGSKNHSSLYFDLSSYFGERHELMVSVDVATGNAYFYVDGEYVGSQTNTEWAGITDIFDQTSALRIGGDLRSGNGSYLKEELFAVSMYKGLAVAGTDGKYGTDGLAALFEYDLTNIATEGYLDDLSANDNNAINPTTYVDPTHVPEFVIGREDDNISSYPDATYDIVKRFSEIPETVEAWVYIPNGILSSRIGVILGNYSGYQKDSHLNFELAADGVPRIQWYGELNDDNTGRYDIRFSNSKIPADTWTHLAFVYDNATGVTSCYLNGELSETKYFYPSIPESAIDCDYVFGGDNRNLNAQYFKGELADVTVYSDVRSAEEIKADYQKGMAMTKAELDSESCMLYYDLDKNDVEKDITDDSGNGFDAVYSDTWLTEAEMEQIRKNYGFDSSYSFAVIGDTQYTTRKYPEHLPTIYKWIIANKDEKNIKYVMGLGDITDANGKGTNESYDNYIFVEDTADELGGGYFVIDKSASGTEWDVAYHAITILDGNLEYSVIRGNHDILSGGNGFNEYFADHTAYTDQFVENGGIYGYDGTGDITDVTNTWRTFMVGDVKYLFMNLDYGANDSILAWAAEIIDRPEFEDHNVIITTHGYLYSNGTTLDVGDYACPTGQNSNNNNGDEIWQKFVSKHANIQMILCGHIYYNNITYNQLKADNGNTVTEMIIDPQGMDNTLKGLGVVAMFYFSEDGTKLAVEFYSTVRDRYYKTINQITLDLEKEGRVLEEDDGWLGTSSMPSGSGAESDPYLIKDAGNLLWMAEKITSGSTASFDGKYFEQICDIDLNGLSIKSIGYMFSSESSMAAFGGHYDGNGYSIKNGSIESVSKSNPFNCDYGYGLFGVIFGATVENVVLDNVEVIGLGVTGAIVGRAASPLVSDPSFESFNIISGCEVRANVRIVTTRSSGTYVEPGFDNNNRVRVGSVCGMAHATVIDGCTSAASFAFTGDYGFAGGIVGSVGVNSTVKNCAYSGIMTLYDDTATQTSGYGGIVGSISPSTQWKASYTGYVHIYNCYNSGNLEFGESIRSAGKITKNTHWAGILGCGAWLSYAEPTEARTYPYLIENCYNLSEGPERINAGNKQVMAGIAGKNLATAGTTSTLFIKNCYSVLLTNPGSDSGEGCCNEYQYQGTTVTRDGYFAAHALENVSTKSAEELKSYIDTINGNIVTVRANELDIIWYSGAGFPIIAAGDVGDKYYDSSLKNYYVSDGLTWVPQFSVEDDIVTAYGIIPGEYADSSNYPIVLFCDGAFIGGYSDLGEATAAALANDPKNSYTILLRANAPETVKTSLQHFWGAITVDLNGYTLVASHYIFDIYEYNNSDITTAVDHKGSFKVMNGSLVKAGGNALICVNYGDKLVKPCTVDISFENVTFSCTSGTRGIFVTWEDGYSAVANDITFTVDCKFTNCVFDFASSIEGITMLPLNNGSKDKVIFNVTVAGGKIVADRTLTLSELVTVNNTVNGRADSFVFTKDENGIYPILELPIGASPISESFNNDSLVFVKAGVADDKVIYGLIDKKLAVIEFTPKVSITLDRNLILNVYIPKIDQISSVEFAGEVISLSDLEEVDIGNSSYYVIRTPFAPGNAADTLKMNVTFTAGQSSAARSYTFSIIKYAERMLEKDTETTEIILIKDVLSYIRAAYAYFDSSDTDQIARIDALLGEKYDEEHPHISDGSADNVIVGLTDATFVLDETPAIRFYLENSTDADSFAFYVGEKKVGTTVGTDSYGAYIELDVYAYAMCDAVTYTVNGTDGGIYHIESYYKFAQNEGNSELISLVDRFIKYCQSAKTYRDEILSGVCYHTYESSVTKQATAKEKGIMEHKCIHCGDTYEEAIPTRIKLLAIGNSFSQDAVQHLYIICKNAGIENIVIGNMYVAGCSLNKHLSNMNANLDAYTFYLSDESAGGVVADSTPRSAKYGIEYTDWDYIIIQQVSQNAGVSSSYGSFESVIEYINTYKNDEAKLFWHMTWAYQSDSTHSGFANFNNDQITMYNAIVSTLQDTVLVNDNIEGFIPVGTAVQNLRTSTLGDTLTRDGYHLSYGIGRYTAALTWFAALTGIEVDDITATPDAYPEVAANLELIKEAVKNAIADPYKITESANTSGV